MRSPSPEDRSRLQRAVQDAEAGSDIELVLSLARESSTYQAEELKAALLVTALLQIVLLLLESWWMPVLEHLFWENLPFSPLWLVAVFPFLCLGLLAWLFNRPAFDRLLVKASRRRTLVEDAAAGLIMRSGLTSLSTRSALLLYYSCNERELVCWADQGLLERCGQEGWGKFCREARRVMQASPAPVEGLVTLAEQVRKDLAPLLPNPDRVNRLSDDLMENPS